MNELLLDTDTLSLFLRNQPKVMAPKGVKVKGVILSDHVKNADWRTREIAFICHLPKSIVEEVIEKLTVLLRPDI